MIKIIISLKSVEHIYVLICVYDGIPQEKTFLPQFEDLILKSNNEDWERALEYEFELKKSSSH
jgi:hypothetical protein